MKFIHKVRAKTTAMQMQCDYGLFDSLENLARVGSHCLLEFRNSPPELRRKNGTIQDIENRQLGFVRDNPVDPDYLSN